ncbi:MAG: hypothetical protein AAF587_10420 [Bacteroidota bacterium]
MATQLDYQLSLKNRKISFTQGKGDRIFTYFIQWSQLMIAGSISYFLLSEGLQQSSSMNPHQGSMLILTLIWSGLIFMYIRRAQISRFRILCGTSQQENRHKVLRILQQLGWEVQDQSEEYIVAYTEQNRLHWGRQFSVLFEEQRILFNCITLERDNRPNPFFPIQDQLAYRDFLSLWHKMKEQADR